MAFYRTYRSTTFADLLGQEAAVATLQGALRLNRVGHAYLFSGPRGTGKTSTARIFARAICCERRGEGTEPCDQCPSCRSVLAGTAPDLVEIDAASNRGIEDIRELREQAHYPPIQLKKRVYIIDEVHMLTTEAFNALLKTLEEPADHVVFILATTELHKVPATIRSRCQLIRFEGARDEALLAKLGKVAKAEKLKTDEEALRLVAAHARGSFRDAESLLERLANEYAVLTGEEVRRSLGILADEEVDRLVQAMLSGEPGRVTPVLEQLGSQPSLEGVISQAIESVRRQIRASSLPLPLLSYALEQLMEAFILQKSAPTPLIALEVACLNICQRAADGAPLPLVQVAARSAAAPQAPVLDIQPPAPAAPPAAKEPPREAIPSRAPALAVKPLPAAAPESVPVVELRTADDAPGAPRSDPRKAWKEMIEEIGRQNLVLAQALRQVVLHSAEGDTIVGHVRYKFHADKLNEKKNQLLIRETLQRLSGAPWQIIYQVTDAVPRRAPSKGLGSGAEEAAIAVFTTNGA